jgi:signal peptidase I
MGLFRKKNKNDKKGKKKEKKKSTIREYIESIVIAIIIAMVIRATVVEAYRIPSGSMEDTLLVGDFLFVNKFIYGVKIPFTNTNLLPGVREPKPGDIIVFKYPENPSRNFIKRCVAVEGQTVEMRNKKLYIDGKQVKEEYVKHIHPNVLPGRDNFGPYKVPKGHLFMMGDNRDNSQDSRFWGPLDEDLVKGKAMIIYFSMDKEDPYFWKIPSIRFSRIGDLIK